MRELADLQTWYASNCDGDWEHSFGVTIGTLDNPGWSVTIDLEETNLEDKSFESFEKEDSEEQWIHCSVKDRKFLGAGDETRLEEILRIFLDWARSQNEDWLKPPEPLTEEELQIINDAEFLNALGEEVGEELCKGENCTHKRIKHSVLCRRHHFEMVMKRPFPEQ